MTAVERCVQIVQAMEKKSFDKKVEMLLAFLDKELHDFKVKEAEIRFEQSK